MAQEGTALYKLVRSGVWRPKVRLVAPAGIDAGEEFDRLAVDLHTFVRRARKSGFVAARLSRARETVVTLWNGAETTNTAEPGDMIVANLDSAKKVLRDAAGNANIYVILAANFPELYERDSGTTEFGAVYRAKGVVDVLYLPGGFEILAPWGQMQQVDDGYLMRSGNEVYGNNKETFERTYQLEG